MDGKKQFEVGTAVFFSVESEDGTFAEKEGEIREINEEDPTYDSCGRTYEILVHAEHRIYSSVPEETVREITSASGVEDGWYGFSADDMEEALLNTVQSLWYGMDPRGGGEGEEIEAFGGHISEEMERILLNGLNEDASGFFVDSDDPPEDEGLDAAQILAVLEGEKL